MAITSERSPRVSRFGLKSVEELAKVRHQVFERLMALYKKAGVGHIGSSLSCLELLVYLYHRQMRQQDVLILSKGHAAGALYVVLDSVGRLGADLNTFYQDGSLLAGHPPCTGKIPAIPFGTGSLGHGLSLASGMALAARLKRTDKKIYCILSDGDCNEGSTWEAFHFAAQHKLDNLIIILDLNGLQGLGESKDIYTIEPMAEKLALMNVNVTVARQGNTFADIAAGLLPFEKSTGQVNCLVAHTIKGHSVSFMENKMEWHYLPMNESQYESAVRENGTQKSRAPK